MSKTIYFTEFDSPIGALLIQATVRGVSGIWMQQDRNYPRDRALWIRDDARLGEARQQLEEYFSGSRAKFDVPLDLVGTEFQRRVWTALQDVDYGQTISYALLARIIQRPHAVRAVGSANGRNRIPIIIPCHRVIGSDGSLTGYSGGIERKRWLLAHERATVDTTTSSA